jgi:hypothetical protein
MNKNEQKQILEATHQGALKIGDKELDCAVLEDGTRVISLSAVFKAFGRTKRGRAKYETRVPNMPALIDAKNLQPFISSNLEGVLKPIEYQKKDSQNTTTGYSAEIIPLICETYLEARDKGALLKQQLPLARASEILIRSLSKIGIIALVDEATGYQYDRARKALEEILDKFISKELRKWAKTFPDEFYQEMFRLRGWQYVPFSAKRPSVVGKYTNDLVYERLAPGVLEELKRKTPKTKSGHRKHKFFQWLTEDVGHPRLREHLTAVIALMKASTKWDQFYRLLQRALPKYAEQMQLPLDEPD